jgi:hypothetical protein
MKKKDYMSAALAARKRPVSRLALICSAMTITSGFNSLFWMPLEL